MKNYEFRENELTIYGNESSIKDQQFSFLYIEDLKIEDGIYYIGNSAFYSCGIKNIELPNTLKIIKEKAFYSNKLTKIEFKDNIEYIGEYAFMENKLESIILSNRLLEINKSSFMNNKIEDLVIPDSVIKINKSAFMNNEIKQLKLSKNLNEIGEEAFYNNELTHIVLPSNLERIGSNAFSNNKLTEVVIPSKIEIIDKNAFSGNEIIELKLNEKLKIISNSSFYNNKITYLDIPKNVIKIDDSAFFSNEIEKIKFNEKIEYIGSKAFANNNLEELNIPLSVNYIADSAFTVNQIKSIRFNDNLKEIKSNAFSHNLIENLILPNSLEKIESYAFYDNNIKNIILPNTLKSIGEKAFSSNSLINVNIPNSIEKIGTNAFDSNVIVTINNHTLPNYFIKRFGTENIIKASKILEIAPNFDFNNINVKMLDVMIINNDNIKGFMNNIKVYDKLIDELHIQELYDFSSEEYIDFYKMCYILGLFNTGGIKQKEIIKKIKEIFKLYNIDDIHEIFTTIELKEYNEKVSNILLNEYNHPKFREIVSKFYNNYSVIIKSILENKKEIIGLLNAKIKTEQTEENILKLEKLKRTKKEVTIDDIIKYIEDHVFIVKEENEQLNNIITILCSYLNQEEFDKIQNIYEKAKQVNDKYFSNIVDKKQDGINYYWPSKDNPINIVLGYLCDCCAKYNGAGEDIMIQSMINPSIKNLVIYDSMRNVIAKSTAFYNEEKRYLLFNNVEIKKGFMYSKRRKEEDFDEILDSIIRGIKDQIKSMKEKGYIVDDVRIGMARNDLKDAIIRKRLQIKHSKLLNNYPYNNYEGDANDIKEGQAIIKIKK